MAASAFVSPSATTVATRRSVAVRLRQPVTERSARVQWVGRIPRARSRERSRAASRSAPVLSYAASDRPNRQPRSVDRFEPDLLPVELVLQHRELTSADAISGRDNASEVEVRFTAEGAERITVELEHRRIERLAAAQAAYGAVGGDGGWTAILRRYADAVAA